MADSKKKPTHRPEASQAGGDEAPAPFADPIQPPASVTEILSREELDQMSTLQLIDLIARKLPPRHTSILDLIYLRDRIQQTEELNEQARDALEKLDAIVEKLRSPAFRVGTFLAAVDSDRAHVCLGGTDYVCRVDPAGDKKCRHPVPWRGK